MANPKDTRNSCKHCGVKTWRTDYVEFLRDHDRPDGRRCQAAAREYAVPRKHGYVPPTYPKDGRCTLCGKRRDDDVHEDS